MFDPYMLQIDINIFFKLLIKKKQYLCTPLISYTAVTTLSVVCFPPHGKRGQPGMGFRNYIVVQELY